MPGEITAGEITAGEITADGAFPQLFTEYVDYKRGLGYVYPHSRLYLVRRLSRFLAGRPADERVLTRHSAEAFASPGGGRVPRLGRGPARDRPPVRPVPAVEGNRCLGVAGARAAAPTQPLRSQDHHR